LIQNNDNKKVRLLLEPLDSDHKQRANKA